MTLNNWAEQAIAQMDETHRQNYREVYNAAWKKPLGSRRLQSLTAQEIQAAADAMLAAGKSAKTVRNAWSVLAVLLVTNAVNFIDGIAQKLPDVIQSGVNLLLSCIEGITSAIDNNSARLANDIRNLFLA